MIVLDFDALWKLSYSMKTTVLARLVVVVFDTKDKTMIILPRDVARTLLNFDGNDARWLLSKNNLSTLDLEGPSSVVQATAWKLGPGFGHCNIRLATPLHKVRFWKKNHCWWWWSLKKNPLDPKKCSSRCKIFHYVCWDEGVLSEEWGNRWI